MKWEFSTVAKNTKKRKVEVVIGTFLLAFFIPPSSQKKKVVERGVKSFHKEARSERRERESDMAKHSIPLRYVFSLLLPSSSSRQIRNSVGEKHHEFSLTNSVQNSSLPNCLEKQFYGTTRTHVFYAINIVFIAYQLYGSFIKYFISVSAKIGHCLFLGCQSREVTTNSAQKILYICLKNSYLSWNNPSL